MTRRRALPWAFLTLALAGCGGSHRSSGSTSTDTVGPQVAIAWPARSRAFAAPGAATAAQIALPGAGANGSDLTQVVARPSGTAAVTQTYQLSVAVHPGNHLLRVDFLADAASTAAPLATATANVEVTRTGALQTTAGAPLGTVAYGSNVTGLTIAGGQTVEVGQKADLVVTATTAGGIVALTPGSVTFALSSGAGDLGLGADGSVAGIATGKATLAATADGVTSDSAVVTILPAPVAARTIALATTDLVPDPTRGLVWVALTSIGTDSNTVESLDASSGAVAARIAVGGSPTVLAIADDGSALYAGLQDAGTVQRIDLTTNVAATPFALPPGVGARTYAHDIAVQPGNPATVAITRQDFYDSGYDGPAIFDDGVARANSLGVYDGLRLLWTAPNRIVAYQPDSGPAGFEDVAVDAQGATLAQAVPTQADLSQRVVLAGGRLYGANGVVADATTLAPLGTFTQVSSSVVPAFYGPAVDVAGGRAYFIELDGTGTLRVHAYSTATFAELAAHRITGVTLPSQTYRLTDPRPGLIGTDRLVFRLADQVVFLDGVSSL